MDIPRNKPQQDILREMFCIAIELMIIRTISSVLKGRCTDRRQEGPSD